ncbi:peptidase associated/transthyretin-like domain-containing protein [Spirosoma pollinicola]|uniref:Carboxypeptidase regulatory-like domain-containing protein n=1 Tax=Spirosoma pollinicola TaxID=2057025 RepID=A0A2K8Z2N5_9BACT|nr:hypothetical protein [Spirosoma pollinicola]AUD04146.1 hypothetical protein CWM47_21300 [Spirosoma pollinicola]
METIKAVKHSLLLAILTGSLSCGFTAVDKQTSITGTVQLNTGKPVENYPLSVLAKNGSTFGGSNLVSQQDFRTDKNGAFAYQGLFLSEGLGGLGYELRWAFDFKIQDSPIQSIRSRQSSRTPVLISHQVTSLMAIYFQVSSIPSRSS